MGANTATCRFGQFQTNDVDELFSWDAADWDFDYRQVTPGQLGFHYQELQLDDVRLSLQTYGQRMFCRDAYVGRDCIVSVVIAAEKPPRVFGKEVGAGGVLIHQPGVEKEYVLEAGTSTMDVTIPAAQCEELGWGFARELLHEVPRELVRNCFRNWKALKQVAQLADDVPDATIRLLHRELFVSMQALLQPWLQPGSHRATDLAPQRHALRLVRRAQQYMATRDVTEKLAVDDLAVRLGVSSRTLFGAFRRCVGVGPYQYDLICRLYAFRRGLRQGSEYPGKITRAALDAGFFHLGQLNLLYRRYFGETPTETMRRDSALWSPGGLRGRDS